jgi:BNR/Asp-box repeat
MNLLIGRLGFVLMVIAPAMGQWQQSRGTEGLNMQSLLTRGAATFAGGMTGAYISNDEGVSYRLSNSGNDNVGPTRGFADDGTFIFTCTSAGVFRSRDLGASWIAKKNGLKNLLTSGIVYAAPYLIVVTPTGAFRSADQGDNWESAGLDQKDVRCIATVQGVLLAGTNGEGIYRSIDFGKNWAGANTGLNSSNFRAIETKGSTSFAAGGVGSGVFRSTDQGLTWSLLTGGLPSSSYRGFASNAQLVVAGSFGAGVFYSTDNGETWKGINQGLPDLTIFDVELTATAIIAATNTRGVFRFPLVDLNLPTIPDNAPAGLARLTNISLRASVGSGEATLIAGFVVTGTSAKRVLVRGVGPGLGAFGLTGLLPDPRVSLYDSAARLLASNDDFDQVVTPAGLVTGVGAFSLTQRVDAALIATLAPGNYTAQVTDASNRPGLALVEIYEADATSTRISNLSGRAFVGSGASVAIGGLSVQGTRSRQFLVRGIGPALTAFGVSAALADPVLTLTTAAGATVGANNDWESAGNSAELLAAAAQVGAFALPRGSKDAAVLISLEPGNYTALISGANGTSGIALLEVYELP